MNNEQIDRFLKSESSPEEANAVIQYLQQHPEKIEEILVDEEWETYRQPKSLEIEKSSRLWENIESQMTIPSLPSRRILILKRLAVAASVLFAVIIGWWWLNRPSSSTNELIVKANPEVKVIENNGKEVMLLTLPDNSNVQLMPSSMISYKQGLGDGVREVELKGEAFFKVTKDSLLPFIVYSDAISTKVLGTQFLVTSFPKDSIIRVALFSGSVIVQQIDSLHNAFKDNFHLRPGEVLLFNKNRMVASITSSKKDVAKKSSEKTSRPNNNLLGNNWYMFNNQNLAEVFDQLQVLYNERIVFSKKDVEGLSFIGKIDKNDSLETILNEIGKLNNLTISKEQYGFYIKKK